MKPKKYVFRQVSRLQITLLTKTVVTHVSSNSFLQKVSKKHI